MYELAARYRCNIQSNQVLSPEEKTTRIDGIDMSKRKKKVNKDIQHWGFASRHRPNY